MKSQIIIAILSLVFVGSVFAYYNPIDNDKWCERNMPELNFSFNEKVSYCYDEGWDKYCEIIYPEYCPNNNYSDYDRCLRSCKTYGGECPCDEIHKKGALGMEDKDEGN